MRTRSQILSYLKEYRTKNAEKISQQKKDWYQKNIDQEREKRRQHYLKNKERYFANATARKAIKASRANEKYTRMEIYNKFFGSCYICALPIDIAIKHPDGNSFSIHHVRPLSKGGDNTKQNVAPTHLRCNLKMSSKWPSKELIVSENKFWKMGIL